MQQSTSWKTTKLYAHVFWCLEYQQYKDQASDVVASLGSTKVQDNNLIHFLVALVDRLELDVVSLK